MRQLFNRLWNDDCGALISIEFLFIATVLVIGLVVGWASVRDAVVNELAELSDAILALSQEYTVSGLTGCCSSLEGSATTDTPANVIDPACTLDFETSDINQTPCD